MRKKLFAILMSAMMMVTFMPAMAFAAAEDVVVWNSDYTTCSVNGIDYTVTQYVKINQGNYWDGTITAVATHPDADGVSDSRTKTKTYRDLRSSKVTKINNSTAKHVMTYEDYVTNFYNEDLALETVPVAATLSIPKTVKKNLGTSGRSWENDTFEITGRLNMTAPAYDAAKMYEIQKFSLPVVYTHDTTENYDRVGVVPAWDLQVEAATVTANAKLFAVDGKTFTGNYRYDGAEHEIVMKSVPAAYTVVFKKYNKTTGVYDVVEKATFKDVATYEYVAQVYKNGAKHGSEVDLKTVVRKASIDATIGDNYVYEGTTINAWDYVDLAAANKAYTSAAKAAKADEAAIKAALATRFDIAVKKTSEAKLVYDGRKVVEQYNLTVTDKFSTMTTAEKTAYTKATANWNLNENAFDGEVGTVYVVEGTKANEIEFVQAPSVKKYHNKKGVLKKSYTFTVKAEATSGVAPTYKLINGNSKIVIDKTTGKITVKKGLKKGTYTVKVKAYGAAGNGYAAASETQTIKIVMTK